jgi:ribosome-associated protein
MTASVEARQFAIEAARIANDLKCEDVVVMDLRGLSSVTDFFVIATGSSDRQLRSVAERIEEYGHKVGSRVFGRSGVEQGQWLLIDFVDVVVHLFDGERRAYYDLELLWGDAPKVNWALQASA